MIRERKQIKNLHKTIVLAQYDLKAINGIGGHYSGKIAALPDLWAYGESEEECAQDLRRLVEGWILMRIARREPLPPVTDG